MPWTDLVDPTHEEILRAVATRLDPDAVEMLAAPATDARNARPLLEAHGAYVLAVLSRPRVAPVGDGIEYFEIDVLAAPGTLVTIRKSGPRGDLAPVDGVAARIDSEASPGQIVHAVVDDAADAFLELLDALYEQIDELEGDVERLPGPEVRRRVAALRHELLVARRTASATRGVARRVLDGRIDVGRSELFPPEVEALFVDTYETLVRATEELDVARDLLAGVRDYYQAKITEQQNDVAKKLTVIASLVLVPSLIVGFYGQNFEEVFDSALLVARDLARPDRRVHARPSSPSSAGAAGSEREHSRPPTTRLPSKRVSAPAHTSSADGSFALGSRLAAVLERALPFAGPALALVLGAVALGRRPLDVDEASALAAAQGPSRTSSSVRSPTTRHAPATSRCSSRS